MTNHRASGPSLNFQLVVGRVASVVSFLIAGLFLFVVVASVAAFGIGPAVVGWIVLIGSAATVVSTGPYLMIASQAASANRHARALRFAWAPAGMLAATAVFSLVALAVTP